MVLFVTVTPSFVIIQFSLWCSHRLDMPSMICLFASSRFLLQKIQAPLPQHLKGLLQIFILLSLLSTHTPPALLTSICYFLVPLTAPELFLTYCLPFSSSCWGNSPAPVHWTAWHPSPKSRNSLHLASILLHTYLLPTMLGHKEKKKHENHYRPPVINPYPPQDVKELMKYN